jgi:hypothetical protein
MASALASMDLFEQVAALFPDNAPHEDAIGAMAVEIPFYHRVLFSQSHYVLSRCLIFRKEIVFQVVLDLGDPCIVTSLRNRVWLLEVFGTLEGAHNP